MKANELMIGDWVVYNGDTKYENPIQIEGMDIGRSEELITSDREDVGFEGIWPIPLTPEILEKNGWEKCNTDDDGSIQYEKEYGNINCNLWLPTDKFPGLFGCSRRWEELTQFYDMVNELPCSYVHELQHALRLCGIEKEIIL